MTNYFFLVVGAWSLVILPLLFALREPLRRLFGLLDRSHVHERILGQMVPFAVANFLEAADRVFERRDCALLTGEYLGHDERLREESLDSAGAVHDQLVVFTQFIDAQDGYDVLQLAISLQRVLNAAGHAVMVFTHVLWIEHATG